MIAIRAAQIIVICIRVLPAATARSLTSPDWEASALAQVAVALAEAGQAQQAVATAAQAEATARRNETTAGSGLMSCALPSSSGTKMDEQMLLTRLGASRGFVGT